MYNIWTIYALKTDSTDFLAAPDICVFATSKRNTFVIALRSHAYNLREADVLYLTKCKEKTWKILVRKNLSSEILGAPMKKPQRNYGPSDSQPTIACTWSIRTPTLCFWLGSKKTAANNEKCCWNLQTLCRKSNLPIEVDTTEKKRLSAGCEAARKVRQEYRGEPCFPESACHLSNVGG